MDRPPAATRWQNLHMPQSRTPLIVAIGLLLLPVLYVGSYLSLVRPIQRKSYVQYHYPLIGAQHQTTIFWPLEKIDGRVRPASWQFQPDSVWVVR